MKTLSKLLTVALLCACPSSNEAAGFFANKAGNLFKNKSADFSKKAYNGRILYSELQRVSMNREALGLSAIWPVTPEVKGDDIGEMDFSTAEDYFNELFDMGNFCGRDWRPYVNKGIEMSILWGFGVDGPKAGQKLGKDNLGWSIAKDMPEDAPDFMPLLVSSNVRCEELLSAYTVKSDEPLHTADGNPAVIITKGGAARVFPPRYFRYSDVYGRTFHAVDANAENKLTYLVPGGKVSPSSH